jgi:hypothetical protein
MGLHPASLRGRLLRVMVVLACVLPLLPLLPHLASGTDVVRLRNAVLLQGELPATFDWGQAPYPAGFMVDVEPTLPYFADLVRRLGVAELPDDRSRVVALATHLLASQPVLYGGAVRKGLEETHRAITQDGQGYCNDFVRVFQALASAAGMRVRVWAFSFDGFGGHGHVFPEVWNRQRQQWELVDLFNNYLFTLQGQTDPLSARDFRRHMSVNPQRVEFRPLVAQARVGWQERDKGVEYYQLGLQQWYLFWGSNAMDAERGHLARALAPLGYTVTQVAAVAEGRFPGIRLLADQGNRDQIDALRRLRTQLMVAAGVWAVAAAGLVLWVVVRRTRRRQADARMLGGPDA